MFTESEKIENILAGENPHNRPRADPAASRSEMIDGPTEVSNPKERELQIEKRVRKIIARNPVYQDLLYR